MKFLTIFFAVLFLLSGGFWLFGSAGSGAGIFALIVFVLFLAILGYSKYRTGKWFTDSSGGH